MKKFIISMLLVAGLCSCEGFYGQKLAEKEVGFAEKSVNRLFEAAQQCPAMVEQCKDPEFTKMLVEGTDCVSCKAMCLLWLRENCRDWDDTIGELPEADNLTEDASTVIDFALENGDTAEQDSVANE